MSVSEVKFLKSEGGYDEQGNVTYNVKYQILTSSRTDGILAILYTSGLPVFGDTYETVTESDGRASLRSASAEIADDSETLRKWIWSGVYSSKGTDSDSNQSPQNTDQVDWAWKASGSFAMFMRSPEADKDGRALVNTTNEPFMPPPEIDDPQLELILEKNTPSLSLTSWSTTRGKVNSVTMWGLIPRAIKMRQWSWKVHYVSKSFAYIENRFDLGIKIAGHYYQPLNAGFRENGDLDIAGKRKYNYAKSEDGIPLASPRLLDVNGKFLVDGATPTFFDQVAGNTQRFKLEDEYDFSSILPAVIPGPITT